ncbi:MAG TPA: hypothetical protein VLD84_00190 [Nitrososphaeraceae archaeon]|nr:hypothetical protein [Nitrososphaeraceae archaeon]
MNNLQRLKDREDKYDDSNDKLKTIVLSKQNYDRLKEFGFCGDSFNTVIERLLDKVEGI